MELQAKDLRIGNLLQTSKNEIIEVDSEIIRIFENKDGLLMSNYNPIPLTEEWLLKFGFYKFNEAWELKRPIEYEFNFRIWDGMLFNENGIEIQVKYVHQLQNLYFALTGEELIIK